MPFMKKSLLMSLAGAALTLQAALISAPAWALASDRDQPMNIEADALRHDDAKQVTVFSGNVVVTKGSIVLRGETLTVVQTADGQQNGTIEAAANKRAFFSQQRDTPAGAPKETIQGEAKTIEYNSSSDQVRLIGNGELRRYRAEALNDEITGSLIVYNNRTGHFSVDGQQRQGTSGGGRVRAVIGASSTNADAKPGRPAQLQPSQKLESAPASSK